METKNSRLHSQGGGALFQQNIRKVLFFSVFFLTALILIGFFPVQARTDETEEKQTTVRVGYYTDSEEFQYGASDEDHKTGYAYEYYQEVAKYTGWSYEYVYGSFTEIMDKLEAGEVDIVAGVSKTEEHLKTMLFPDYAMGGETYYIYVPDKDEDILATNTDFLDGKRIGVKKDTCMQTLVENYAAEKGVDVEIISYATLEDRMEAYNDGELDLLVTVENDRMEGFKPVYNLGSWDFYFAVNKNRPDLLEALNQAQEDILSNFPYYTSRLNDKYFNRSLVQQSISDEEKAWIRVNPEIVIGYLADYMPYCGTDSETKVLEGMLAEVLPEIEKHTGLTFTCVGFDSFSEMMESLHDGAVDAVFPIFGDLWYAEQQNYSQTLSIVSTRMAVVYKDNYSNDIYNKIAVAEGSPIQSYYLQTKYPDSELVDCGDWADCMDAINSGKATCTIADTDQIFRCKMQHAEFKELQMAELSQTVDFTFAVRRTDSTLYTILNKGINCLDETAANEAVIRSSYVDPAYSFSEFISAHFAVFCLLIVAFIAFLVLMFLLYRKQVKKDRAQIMEAYEREKKHIELQQQTQSALQEAYDAARGANRAKSEFLARMSHDIRTPLNAVLGLTTIARTHIDDPVRVEDCLSKISSSGAHLLALINEVLDMSKIEAGQMVVGHEEFDLVRAIEETLIPIQADVRSKDQELAVSMENICHKKVMGDKLHVQKVLVNILGNAVKYTLPGGKISLTVTEKSMNKPYVSCYTFVVEDTGVGISKEFLGHIFETFSREGLDEVNQEQGSGLGLSIVYNLVQMMGGDIRAESELGKGSRFTVTLFLKLPEREDEDSGAEERLPELSVQEQLRSGNHDGKHVLMAEDNELNAEIATEFLEMAEVSVDRAVNGAEALEMLEKAAPGTYDLVFLDIQMPVMDGYEAARRIRASEREDIRNLPVIAMTANAFSTDIKKAREAGMNGHIAKPLDIKRLAAVLEEFLGGGKKPEDSGEKPEA